MRAASKARIVLLTGSSLSFNPRAAKEASALARAGYDVYVLGAWLDATFKMHDQRIVGALPFKFVPVLDLTRSGLATRMAWFGRRIQKKAAHLAYRLTGVQSPLQFGLDPANLLRPALRLGADLYLAHSEPGLYAARRLLRCGHRVGVDLEDWFSEDLLPEARRYRPLGLLRSLERDLLLGGSYASCPSQSMSLALANEYKCTPPCVVYNAFSWSERQTLDETRKDRPVRDIPSIHWYSTTLGPGRGIEDLLAATRLLQHDVEIHLRGNPTPGFADWIAAQVPETWRRRIFFHGLVPNGELLSRIAEHDIGFAGELTYCRSRDLTITNKIMHYLLGGLAVVASDTTGQREVERLASDAVQLYASGDPRALAGALNQILGDRQKLGRAQAAACQAAQRTFCWERQERVLLDAVAHALGRPPPVESAAALSA